MKDFQQLEWDDQTIAACRALVNLALEEDLADQQDWTTVSMVPETRQGRADAVVRETGVVAGIGCLEIVVEEMQADITIEKRVSDSQKIDSGTVLAQLSGNVRDMLTTERTMLNLLSRLMGIATLSSQYVAETQDTKANVYDTRKTTPGWRRLEKYAARCGGARNHRTGLFDAVLIKDNHLAQQGREAVEAAEAVSKSRDFLREINKSKMIVEIEVDTLEQLTAALPSQPDIVLLDNMSLAQLKDAVSLRNNLSPQVQLEASGGVRLETMRQIAKTGVDRISVGALTHSARSLDIGLDWQY